MISQILTREFDNNFSYFIGDKHIAIVDPADFALLETEIVENVLIPEAILVTHSHHDHISGVMKLVNKYAIPAYIHENGRGKLDSDDNIMIFVKDNDVIKLKDYNIRVIYTPGHIDDAVCFYISAKEAYDGIPKLLTGDTLFVEGCGRVDFEYSNVEDMFNSLQKIKNLPDDTVIYPGHHYGSTKTSTLGREKKHNKYLMCKDLEEFKAVRIGC